MRPASQRRQASAPIAGEAPRWGRRQLWRRWVVANAWAETVGLGVSAATAVLVLPRTSGAAGVLAGAVAVVLVSGTVEGGVVGWAQHRVLRTALPELPARRWIGATVIGAAVAWTLGMVPATAFALADASGTAEPTAGPPLALQLLFAVALGAVTGPILGGAQAVVLRAHVARAWRWLLANAAAWAAGMPLVFLVAGGLPPGWHVAVVVAVVAGTLATVGAVVGAVHGAVLVRMLAGSSTSTDAATGSDPTG